MATKREGERKRVPWTEEEHRAFLAGLSQFGKGKWREISRNFVTTKTPRQVASHAEKYFLKMNTCDKKNCRFRLFGAVISDLAPSPETSISTSALNNPHEVKEEANHHLQDKHLVGISSNSKDLVIPTLFLTSNQTFSSSTHSTGASPSSEDSDLELRLAPPQPHS